MKTAIALAACLAMTVSAMAQEVDAKPKRSSFDIVFCIDCSGSMGGIIETAKKKIWMIVNEVARSGKTDRLRIGLIGYGNGDQAHRMFPLTDDLDKVYENLMTFKDEGWGDEWVGLAIRKATKEMEWNPAKDALKLIFVAGNETARQGTEDVLYTVTAPEAIRAGIMINTIYCGTPSAEEEATWKEVSSLADGSYAAIDQSGGAVSVPTPFDEELGKLTGEVNKTYLYFGSQGRVACERQQAMDEESREKGADTLADRASAKNWAGYNNAGWDLVDACKAEGFTWESVKKEDLSEELQKLSVEELKKHVEAMSAQRAEVQSKITELSQKRDAFIDAELAKLGDTRNQAFDEQVRRMIQAQAEK